MVQRHLDHGHCAARVMRVGRVSNSHFARNLCLQTVVALSCCGLASRAVALDLDDNTSLVTDTVASRQHLKTYDGAKKFGAEAISDRSRVHVQPEGVRAGNFMFFPSVDSKVVFDDNVFGASKDAVSDIRFEASPVVRMRSQLPRHILNMAFGANLVSYAEQTDQNYADYFGSIDGGIHINHAHTLGISVSSQLKHEERSDVASSTEAGEPVAVFHHKATVGLTRDAGRLHGTISASAERFDYQDSRSVDGTVLDQDTRDMDFFNTQLRAGYRFSPGFELIGKMRLLRQLHSGIGADDLDATGYEAIAGLAFETSPLLRWRVLGGYGLRDFDEPGTGDVSSGLFKLEMEWLATQRMTIIGAATREFVDTSQHSQGGGLTGDLFETTAPQQEGSVKTSLALRADIEVFNNAVLSVGGEIAESEFNAVAREDRTYSAYAELQYYLNKHLLISLGIDHQTRDSSVDAFDVERNRIMVGAKIKY